MTTAKDVKIIIQQATDGVENGKLLKYNVNAVDDKVQIMADGGQHLFNESPASSLIIITQTSRQIPRKWR